jgi:DNA-binding response OmpR family regulator
VTSRILLVDDDSDISQFVRVNLESVGLEVVGEETNGKEAVRRIVDDPPDLVITNIMMPGLDGIEVLRKLQELDVHVPVLILSAAAVRRGEEALALGAVGAIAKPFDPVKLLAAVKEVLAGRKVGLILPRGGPQLPPGEPDWNETEP